MSNHSRRRSARFSATAIALGAAALAAACAPMPTPETVPPTTAPAAAIKPFQHVSTFDVRLNGNQVAEIVDSTADGRTLFYTDSDTGSIGVIDASLTGRPLPGGRIELGGSPTSVAVLGNLALVGIDSTTDLTAPAGSLAVVDLTTRTVVRTFDLDGQPDSVAVSPNGTFAAVVLENQRDEDLDDGLLPQAPAGDLVIVDLAGDVATWSTRNVGLTGLAEYGTDDPEPEFVDINADDQAVVSFQENNHLAVIDLASATVTSHFSAGSATAVDVDATEEKIGPDKAGDIHLTETVTRRREPDAVAWIDSDSFATANEGDYKDADGKEGGSRGFTIFNVDGTVEFEAGSAWEHEQVRAGHHNESRAANKGGEPEAVEFGRFGDHDLLFVGAERANTVGVYDVGSGTPEFVQVLPTGIGPEGLKAIPQRRLLAVASETSVGAIPSMVTFYQQGTSDVPGYPTLRSADDERGVPVPFVAQSGLAADPADASKLYSVSDSILGVGYIYEIDNSSAPATITRRTPITGASFNLDLEGIAVAPDGGFWVASEGAPGKRPNALVKVSASGQVVAEHFLPESLASLATTSGFEGVALDEDGTFAYAAIQREWSDDAKGSVKIARLDLVSGEWTFVRYGLDAVESPAGGWVGLSEVTLLNDGRFAFIERDNKLGDEARVKRVYVADLAGAEFRLHGQELVTVEKVLHADLLERMGRGTVLTPDKVEGLAVDNRGRMFAVTDNDGMADALGQTLFFRV